MAPTREWLVHPNRSALGPDEPGQNGHFRSVKRPPRRVSTSTHLATVQLPAALARHADPDGSITFGGRDWRFVVGAARVFAKAHITQDVPPPFGYRDRGQWWWWDNTTTTNNILETPEAIAYVREYLEALFPGYPITVGQR